MKRNVFTEVNLTGAPFHGLTVTEVVNPVTRSIVKLEPPLKLFTTAQLEAFKVKFDEHCDKLWSAESRDDPRIIDPYEIFSLFD